MKYSIIICYRDRKEHLDILSPRLNEVFSGSDFEIILVEQDDNDKFLRGNLLNAGAQHAKGDILIFHDVDHYPVDEATRGPGGTTFFQSLPARPPHNIYEPPKGVDMWLPIRRVEYIDNEFNSLPREDVPSGYRHFKDGVDADFYGGVSVFRREAFFKINGFSSLYRGWGLEDADLRERVKHYGLNVQRGDGEFYALQHENSDPGIEDTDFQRNQQIFSRWGAFLHAGVNTQTQTTNVYRYEPEVGILANPWIKATNFLTTTPEGLPFMSIDGVTEFYQDVAERHVQIWNTFKTMVNEYAELKNHRDWVVQNDFGYGNRAFHWMWNLICKELPMDFKFLEIGVFKGQVISLMSLLNKHHKKNGMVYGITPLTNAGDKYSKHPEVDYEDHIQRIYQNFGLDASDLGIIQGFSNDPDIIETALEIGPFDVVFVDGCHDYDVVVSDIINYGEMLKPGGLMVIDDVSNYLNIPDGLIRMDWRGLEDVSNAARDTIEKDANFNELFAVGHNRIWKKNV